ncbi:hypothetical protein D5400_03510 [Georhizobium profundi]|uniref:Uncharacterized protein n=1 Tax=Georhizobium profundi TaxID=2341112 RepID=A0A3Q8XLP1_9HYPH|nr:hypothetical protein [Georhizobium profundi]AZN70464.1 hypothetical protein D5400_03510 [Georhizobium profundi]
MADQKTYSVLLAWSDDDIDQGEFGEVVRAANEEEAEAKARAVMRNGTLRNIVIWTETRWKSRNPVLTMSMKNLTAK